VPITAECFGGRSISPLVNRPPAGSGGRGPVTRLLGRCLLRHRLFGCRACYHTTFHCRSFRREALCPKNHGFELCARAEGRDRSRLHLDGFTGARIPRNTGRAAALLEDAKPVRQRGKGLVRVDDTKTAAGRRTIPLPPFAVTALTQRHHRAFIGEQPVIFASSTGTLRDPENFAGQWRKARDQLGVPDISTHSFRKTVATLIDDAGLSARIGADHLGHAKVSMTTRSLSCWSRRSVTRPGD
jgi:integrase